MRPRLRRMSWDVLSVYIFSVPNLYDKNQKLMIFYFVDYAVGSNTNAPCWSTGEFLTTERTRFVCKIAYFSYNSFLLDFVDFGELLLCNPQNIYRIAHAG